MERKRESLSHPDGKTNYMELVHYVNICPAYLFIVGHRTTRFLQRNLGDFFQYIIGVCFLSYLLINIYIVRKETVYYKAFEKSTLFEVKIPQLKKDNYILRSRNINWQNWKYTSFVQCKHLTSLTCCGLPRKHRIQIDLKHN